MTLVASGVTEQGSVSAGRRRAEKPKRPDRRKNLARFALLVLGVLVAGAAWVFLVRAAIDFGGAARDGTTAAWFVCGAATLGATGCLLLVFVLCARIWGRVLASRPPRRTPGGRHHR